MSGTWEIALGEKPMNFGPVDNALFKRDTCHSFLVLRNPEGEVVSELHGMAQNPEANTLEYTGGLTTVFNAAASSFGLSDIFKKATEFINVDHKFERLQAVVTDGAWRSGSIPEENIQTIFEGSEEEVLSMWINASNVGAAFNEKEVFYTPVSAQGGGVNSNSVTRMHLDAMGIEISPDVFQLEALGYNHSLIADNPDLLNQVGTHIAQSPEELQNELYDIIYAPESMFHIAENTAPVLPVPQQPVVTTTAPSFAA